MKPLNVALWMAVGALIGAGVGALWDETLLGALAGVLLSWPTGLAFETRKRRWWAVAGLFVNYLLAWEVAGGVGLLISLTCTGITLFMSAAILRDFYGGSEIQAFVHHLKILTGLFKGFHIVGEGKSVVPPGDSPIMGPRLIIVQPDTAVILERGNQRTQVAGPSIFESKPFEYIKTIFDLRVMSKQVVIANVHTQDNLQITVTLSLAYGICIEEEVRRGQKKILTIEIATLEYIADYAVQPETVVLKTLESITRRYVRNDDLRTVLSGAYYDKFQQAVIQQTNQHLSGHGLRIYSCIVDKIQPKQEIAIQMEQEWLERRQVDANAAAEAIRAKAWASAIAIVAGGYTAARSANMPPNVIYREVLRRTLEHLAAQPGVNTALNAQIATDFAELRRALRSGF